MGTVYLDVREEVYEEGEVLVESVHDPSAATLAVTTSAMLLYTVPRYYTLLYL